MWDPILISHLFIFFVYVLFFICYSLKMDVYRLLGDELSYEIALRGVPTDNRTVAEKRVILQGLLRCERNGLSNPRVTDHLVAESELAVCSDKLSELAEDIRQFNYQNASNEFKRINSRLLHVAGRLNQLAELSDLQNTARIGLVSMCMQLMGTVAEMREDPPQSSLLDHPVPNTSENPLDDPNLLLPEIEHLSVAPVMADLGSTGVQGLGHSQLNRPTVTADNPNASSSNRVRFSLPERNVSLPAANSSTLLPTVVDTSRFLNLPTNEVIYHPTSVPVTKWNVTFDGNRSVTDFLDRVDELCESRHVSRQQLFRSAVELFTGDALIWFRSVKRSVGTWVELETLLKKNFLPYDYETKLWNEIRRRSQGAEERVVVFIAVMENLFSKLPSKPSEFERIKVIKSNLLPYFQPLLAMTVIRSLPHLIEVCRSLEEASHCAEQFRPPPTVNRYLLEPELAYRRPAVNRVAPLECSGEMQDMSARTQASVTSSSNLRPSASAADDSSTKCLITNRSDLAILTCWNCQLKGHRSSECTRERSKHCYRCGKPDFTTKTCPNCSGNRTGSLQ